MTAAQYPNPTYATGPNLGWAFDSMGRPYSMTDLATSSSIMSSAAYNAASQLTLLSGNVGETRTYNSIAQMTRIQSGAYPAYVDVSYNYPSSNNNGKIGSQTDNVSGEQVNYAYDAVNRLASAAALSGAWGQNYSYDGFGNLTAQTVSTGSAPAYGPVVPNATTNVVGSADANGNTTTVTVSGTSQPASYDVANRLVSVGYGSPIAYSYAPGNKRVWRAKSVTDGTIVDF
jgi:YD repeat-containing protein